MTKIVSMKHTPGDHFGSDERIELATAHNCDVLELLKVFGYTPEDKVFSLNLRFVATDFVTVTIERYATPEQIKALTAEFNNQKERKTL